jgi:hypothetical protein
MIIHLSALGISCIHFDDLQWDFTIHIGKTKSKCSSFTAFWFSTKFSRLRRLDLTIDEYQVEAKESQELFKTKSFDLAGPQVSRAPENRAFVISLTNKIENKELIALCSDAFSDALIFESASEWPCLTICLGED